MNVPALLRNSYKGCAPCRGPFSTVSESEANDSLVTLFLILLQLVLEPFNPLASKLNPAAARRTLDGAVSAGLATEANEGLNQVVNRPVKCRLTYIASQCIVSL